MYRVGQKEVYRDYRLVRLNGTCKIYDFLHKGSTECGKTDASELGARQCEISRKKTFCVETCILATSLQETRRRFLSNFNLKHRQLKLTPGSKLVQKWFNKFRNLGTVDTSKSPGEVGHQTTGHHRESCRLRPAEPEKVHDLASGTGASAERLSKDHEGRLHRFYFHMNEYFFLHDPSQRRSTDAPVPDAKWTFPGSAGRRRQLARWWWSGGPTSPGDLLLSTVPKLRNLLTNFCTNLVPGVSFSCRCFN